MLVEVLVGCYVLAALAASLAILGAMNRGEVSGSVWAQVRHLRVLGRSDAAFEACCFTIFYSLGFACPYLWFGWVGRRLGALLPPLRRTEVANINFERGWLALGTLIIWLVFQPSVAAFCREVRLWHLLALAAVLAIFTSALTHVRPSYWMIKSAMADRAKSQAGATQLHK